MSYFPCFASEGSGIGSIKDAYREKVFGDTTGLTVNSITGYSGRAEVNEGRWAVDTTNRTVWVYADFTILTSQYSQDYWAQITLVNYINDYRPSEKSSGSYANEVLTTDISSDIPNVGFFKLADSSNANISVCYQKSNQLRQGQRYIIYGSWTY